MNSAGARGLIAVDKMGGKVLFLDPDSYATTHVLDDFTIGSSHEDIDALAFGSNFNPINGKANQDDHV